MDIFISFLLVAVGMGVDAYYQRRIRIAECDAYETGYQQGLKEGDLRRLSFVPEAVEGHSLPSMAAPNPLPPTFAERLRKHGRATVRIK